ncbi:MAG: hypothetical protein ACM3TN_01210, partial [Alphaproteobacteria bacterium]
FWTRLAVGANVPGTNGPSRASDTQSAGLAHPLRAGSGCKPKPKGTLDSAVGNSVTREAKRR